MENWNQTELPECRSVQNSLSDYLENTLAARDAWSVEKHLASCLSCAKYLGEMQATVALLRSAPRFDTSDDFMAKLHAQLDSVGMKPAGPLSRLAGFRDWLLASGSGLRSPRLPALGLSLSAIALLAVIATNQLAPKPANDLPPLPVAAPVVSPTASQQLNHNVALSANSPFDDPAAANLEAHAQMDNSDPNTDGG